MIRVARQLSAAVLLSLVPSALPAQGKWVGHEPPCELSTGHYLVRGAMVYLQQAVETRFPDQRDGRLDEALRVLSEAVTTGGQAEEAAPWYYFGRYYVVRSDPVGADSAFRRAERLAPACKEDIDQYRRRVAPLAMNEALRTWGQQQIDSAAAFFRLGMRLTPDNAELPLYMATMLAAAGRLDSATRYLEVGLERAGDDEKYAQRRREAMRELARGTETVAYQDPVVLQGPQARIVRDTIQGSIDRDSTVFADMVSRVQQIRAAGRQLDPQSLQAFQRESTTVATRLNRGRAVRDSVGRQAAADSVSAARVLDPAIAAYRGYVAAYPSDGDAAMKLARLYSAAGHRAALTALIERVAAAEHIEATELVQGALTLSNEGQLPAARTLLDAALARNPYDYNALFVLGRLLYGTREVVPLMDVAERLRALDPLSQNTMRTVAMAWDLAGQRDSVRHYVDLANKGIGWNVNVTQFTPRDSSTVLTGAVANVGDTPLPATTLRFEFLDASGAVLFSEAVAVPALEPRARERISIRLDRGGAAAWRYRRE